MSSGVYKVGIPNVLITLLPSNPSVPQQTALTQADGSYKFSSLPAGTYTLVETQPPQYLSGGKDTPGNLGGQGSPATPSAGSCWGPGKRARNTISANTSCRWPTFPSGWPWLQHPPLKSPSPKPWPSSPPVVNLGGTTANYTTSSIGGSAVYIAPSATVTDPSGNLSSMTVTITDLKDGSFDNLIIPGQTLGTPSQPLPLAAPLSSKITAAYASATGVLTLSGADSASDYQSVLRSIEHEDTATSPDPSPRTITVMAYNCALRERRGHCDRQRPASASGG